MTHDELLLLVKARRLAATGEGQRIRKLSGLSQGEVADALGVAVMTICRWERGERAPRGAPGIEWARLLDQLDEATTAIPA